MIVIDYFEVVFTEFKLYLAPSSSTPRLIYLQRTVRKDVVERKGRKWLMRKELAILTKESLN